MVIIRDIDISILILILILMWLLCRGFLIERKDWVGLGM